MVLDDVVASLDDRRVRKDSGYIPTGSLGLDLALGGGYGKGRIVELSGDYSTHKTQFALCTVAQAQKTGPVLWLDSGDDFTAASARSSGVDPKNLVISYPESADQAMFTMRTAAADYALMVLDSASFMDFDEVADSMFERWFAWLKADICPWTTVLLLSNQVVTSDQRFTRTLRKWASQRVMLRTEKPGVIQASVLKNPELQPVFHTTQLRFANGSLLPEYELIHLGLESGVLHRNGVWLCTDGELLGGGRDQAYRALCASPQLADAIRQDIITRLT